VGNITPSVDEDSDLAVCFRRQGGYVAGYFSAEDLRRRNPPVVQAFKLFYLAGLQAVAIPVYFAYAAISCGIRFYYYFKKFSASLSKHI
jgi:hypothetical protein